VRPVALVLALALFRGASPLPPTRIQLLGLFGAYFEALRVQTGIPGMAAAIVSDTDVIWDQGFGRQDIGHGISTRADTPFQLDGLTQVMTATLLLRCVEEGRIGLDVPLGQYIPFSAEPGATVRQVLTHTSGPPGNPVFSYNVARLELLRPLFPLCFNESLRQTFKDSLLTRLAMVDSVPGLDAIMPTLPTGDLATLQEARLYTGVLARLAVPYAVSQQGVIASRYGVTTLGPGTGLISTVLDFAKFDLALRQGVLLLGNTLTSAWTPPTRFNASLPHGMGWFVQSYKGVWQFGSDTNASSALLVSLPARGVTLVLLANSDGLAKPASLVAGDVTVSPFARVFLSLVVR